MTHSLCSSSFLVQMRETDKSEFVHSPAGKKRQAEKQEVSKLDDHQFSVSLFLIIAS